jgi:hypothetical protein
MSLRCRCLALALLAGAGVASAAPIVEDYLLPNGEPIVGVYYYSWFHGDPYRHVAWTPEFRYDNVGNEAHIASVLKAMTDYGINQGSYSYWDNEGYLKTLGVHLRHLDALRRQGRACYFSPYLEPRTVDKVLADPDAQKANADFIATFLEKYADHPNFCTVGGVPLINIYVTYYRPNETDHDFQAFLQKKYGTIAGIRAAWSSPDYPEYAVPKAELPQRLDTLTLRQAKPGTIAFADRQELRVQRLQQGWKSVIRRVRERTGKDTRYTGDVSRTIVSPAEYMKGLTGMSWYSFGYALTDPSRRPRLISEMGKYTGTTFLNTISPGYVDRQQRWGGGRVERTPFLYPFAWVKAIQSQPDGIMILTHSEWFEGSIIDVTREYGRQQYETTELYSSAYRAAFRSLFAEKHRRKPILLVFNEWATYGIEANGKGLDHVYGYIKLLESLNLDFDILPESMLSPEQLADRDLVIVPNCGLSLAPGHNEILATWATNGGKLWADQSAWWRQQELPGLLYVDTPFGLDAHEAFVASCDEGRMPTEVCADFLKRLQAHAHSAFADWRGRPDNVFEISSGPRLTADDTVLLPAGNVLPWGAITNHRTTGWGLGKGYTHEDCQPWERRACEFRTRIEPTLPVAEVMAVDSDSGRFRPLSFRTNGETVSFRDTMKFQALYAIVQSPVRLHVPELALSPGETRQLSLELENLTDQPQVCTIALRPTPGLELVAEPAVLAAKGKATVPATLRVGTDYATGNRTIVWQTHCADHLANWWRPATVSLPACIGLRTGVVAGVQGETVTRQIALVNVGEVESTHITVQFEGGTSRIPALAPGEESLVPVTFTTPKLTRDENVPDVELTFNASGKNNGLISKSEVDGKTELVSRAGRPAIRPLPTPPGAEGRNEMIYLFADDKRLPAGDYELEAEVQYFDAGTGLFRIEYDSNYGDDVGNRYHDSATVQLRGTNRWRTVLLPLHRAKLAGRQNAGADLRINGRVAVGQVALRGLRSADDGRTTRPLNVSYTQFGHPITRKLELGILPLRPGAAKGKTWDLNPYGTAVPAYGARASQPTAGIKLQRQGDLIVLENGEASAVWSQDGRLLSLRSAITDADYAAFPGDMAPVLVEGRDGSTSYLSGGTLTVDEAKGLLTGAPVVRDLPGGGKLKIQDKWEFDPAWARLRLTRTATPMGKVDVQDFVPLCLRFDATHFAQVHPLGVGFVKNDVKRGWLESWVSEGWYFLHGGNPQNTVHGIALRIAVPDGGIRRFRYGLMPADELPTSLLEHPKDEFQLRLRGSRTPDQPVTVVVDIRLVPGASYQTAREWAQLDATPPDLLRNAQIRDGDPATCQGVQTIVPRAPLYMFDVNTPPWSTELRGEE